VDRALESAPEGGVLDHVVGSAGHCPPGVGVAEEIEPLRAEPREGEIAIGGSTPAAEASALGLIDEYRAMVYPVLVGGGISLWSRVRIPPQLTENPRVLSFAQILDLALRRGGPLR
jgi:hypothetical protein